MRDKLIKLLGGYTKKEYLRVERKYQALLDSKTNDNVAKIVNEYIFRTLNIIDNYARKELFGIFPEIWASRMYDCIHNNLLRIRVRYVDTGSNVIYSFDTTLDKPKEFIQVLKDDKISEEQIWTLENE